MCSASFSRFLGCGTGDTNARPILIWDTIKQLSTILLKLRRKWLYSFICFIWLFQGARCAPVVQRNSLGVRCRRGRWWRPTLCGRAVRAARALSTTSLFCDTPVPCAMLNCNFDTEIETRYTTLTIVFFTLFLALLSLFCLTFQCNVGHINMC